MDVLSPGGLPMIYYLGVWVYVLYASAFEPVYPSRREDTIESWAIKPQLVLCLCSSLVTSAQQTFTRKKNILRWLSVSASKNPDTHGIVYIRRCCRKGYCRKVFDTDKFGGKVQSLMTQMLLKKVSALWTDHIDCFTYMAESTGAFPYLIFAFFHWKLFHKKKKLQFPPPKNRDLYKNTNLMHTIPHFP